MRTRAGPPSCGAAQRDGGQRVQRSCPTGGGRSTPPGRAPL